MIKRLAGFVFVIILVTSDIYPETENTISLYGNLEESIDKIIETVDWSAIEKIVIRSSGGLELAAIKLGKVVQRHALTVEVDGYCMSACAQYVLPAAQKVIMRDGSFISFHFSVFSAVKRSKIFEGSSTVQNIAAEVEAYYRSLGQNTLVLDFSVMLTGPHCIVKSGEKLSVRSSYDFWVPPSSFFKKMGWDVQNYNVETPETATSVVSDWVKDSTPWVFGLPTEADYREFLKSDIGLCHD